jgi:hypothetical protein
MGPGEAPVLCLLGEGRLKLLSPLGAMRRSSMKSSIMAHHGVDAPLRVEPMKAAHALPLLRERLRAPKSPVMNSKVPMRTVSLRENPSHIKRSPLAATAIEDEGTIGASRGKAHC